MKINTGEMKHKIVIQEIISTKINGIVKESYNDIFCCRAKIINNISTEHNDGKEIISSDNKKFYIRYVRKLDLVEQNVRTKKYRVIYNSKAYNILSFSNIQEENKYFEIITERVGTLI